MILKDLGIIDYKTAWDYQETLLQKNVQAKTLYRNASTTDNISVDMQTRHYFLLCEHTPVYTLGKNGNTEHILLTNEEMEQRRIEFFTTNRGGDITFHGLQQIVGYPILDLEKYDTDIGKYLRNLEEIVIMTIAAYGIKGWRSKGETGVWVGPDEKGKERKICAIGVRCSRWITMHGFALNVNTDLRFFDHIIPCGIRHKAVTSMAKELNNIVDYDEVKEKLKNNFEKVFKAILQ